MDGRKRDTKSGGDGNGDTAKYTGPSQMLSFRLPLGSISTQSSDGAPNIQSVRIFQYNIFSQ